MTIAVVSTTYREADILDAWLEHLLAEDVDLILVADKLAPDGTRDILEHWHKTSNGQVRWVEDLESSHRQAYWTEVLAAEAHECGATWILPADVDDLPYAVNGGTVGRSLGECQHDKLYMRVWEHRDWHTKFAEPHRLPKVAFRWSPDAHVTMGSHEVSLPGGVHDILAMRELKYRSFDHFIRKAADRNTTLEPAARSRNDGSHHLRLENLSEGELRTEWDQMQSRPVIYDPIPTHSSVLLSRFGETSN